MPQLCDATKSASLSEPFDCEFGSKSHSSGKSSSQSICNYIPLFSSWPLVLLAYEKTSYCGITRDVLRPVLAWVVFRDCLWSNIPRGSDVNTKSFRARAIDEVWSPGEFDRMG